jgi:hypothetical protein
MRAVTINLPDALFAELETASSNVHEFGFTPERFAQEAVESALASRRLPRVRLPITADAALARSPIEAESIYDAG